MKALSDLTFSEFFHQPNKIRGDLKNANSFSRSNRIL